MNVVGLDLSLTATGVATASGTEVLRTKHLGCKRLAWLRAEIMERVAVPVDMSVFNGRWDLADLVVLEGYSYGSPNQAHQIGELGGVIRLALYEADIPYVTVAPTALKKYATGKGNSGKAEVLAAAIRHLGYDGHDDNEADALWLRTMAMDVYQPNVVGVLPMMPQRNREALAKVEWPELNQQVREGR